MMALIVFLYSTLIINITEHHERINKTERRNLYTFPHPASVHFITLAWLSTALSSTTERTVMMHVNHMLIYVKKHPDVSEEFICFLKSRTISRDHIKVHSSSNTKSQQTQPLNPTLIQFLVENVIFNGCFTEYQY